MAVNHVLLTGRLQMAPPRSARIIATSCATTPTYIYDPRGPSSCRQMNADTSGNLWVNILPVMGGIVNFCFKRVV